MRIGIDARFFGPRQKGIGRYVQRLVEEMEKVSPAGLEFVIFLRRDNWSDFQPKNPNFKKALADYPWYGWQEQILMPWKIHQAKIDLMHFPHFNYPVFCFKPFVVTIHDLVLRKFPTRRASRLNVFSYWLKNLAYCLVSASAVKRAKRIITISNYTKKDILKYFRINPQKIQVIYEGKPDVILEGAKRPIESHEESSGFYRSRALNALSARSLQNDKKEKSLQNDKKEKSLQNDKKEKSLQFQKLNVTKPYLLYVGNAYPHKNLEKLILAFTQLNLRDYQLALVGELDYFYKRLKNWVNNLGMRFPNLSQIWESHSQIVFTDFVSDEQLDQLYQGASAYIFPSLCEGFGLPPLEAMAYGLPVVCSKATCLPEILGSAALYFNPNDIQDIKQKIKLVLEDKNLRQKLITQGFERIKKYSWSKMAQETLAIYLENTS